MSDAPAIVALSDEGRLVEAAAFLEAVKGCDGTPVQIDAGKASMATSLHLQIILAAEARWAEQDLPFEIINATESFDASLVSLGRATAN